MLRANPGTFCFVRHPMLKRPLFHSAARHDRLSLARTWARWAAWVVMLNGAAALFAAFVGVARDAVLKLGLTPMSPVLGLATIGNGLALWAFVARRRGLHIASAALAMVLGLVGLGLISRASGIAGIPTSVAGALLCLFASVALITGWMRDRSDLVHVTFGIAGFALLSLSITVIGVRIVGAFGPETERIFVGASGQGLASAIVLSAAFLGFVWAEGFTTSEPPKWVAAAAGISALVAVLLLWRALDARETEQLRSQTLLVAQVARDAIYREARSTAASMRRAADRAARGAPLDQQQSDLTALVGDLPGLTAAMRVAANGTVLLSSPAQTDSSTFSNTWRSYEYQHGRFDTLSFIPLGGSADKFALISPVCLNGSCDGAVTGIVDARVFFPKALAGAQGGFLFVVTSGGHVLGTDSLQLPPSSWRENLDLRLGAAEWQFSAQPTDATLRQLRTTLPATVLFMGLIVSALLPVTLRFGQAAWRSARASERARLSIALGRASEGIWERDLVAGNATRSGSLWRHLGYDPTTIAPTAEAWTALVHPDDREQVDAALARHISGDAPSFEAEYRVRGANGDWHVIVDRGRVVDRLPDGRAARLLGIVADVTEARRNQEERIASERRFRATFDSGFQPKLLLDLDGRVLEVNPAALESARSSAAEVLNRPVWETLWWLPNPESAARARGGVAAASSGAAVQYEEEIADFGGTSLVLEVRIKSVSDESGHATQLLLEARDVTAKRRVDAALQELDTLAAMGRIAARVAHEINNPLAGIQYSFLLVKDAIPASHPHFAYVGAIEREISRIAFVTRQLYETYRPEKEIGASASLATIIGDAVSFLEQVNRASAITIETDLSGAPSVVPVPAAVLRQIVYNLVQNAIDASPPEQVVRISAIATNRTLEIRVSDKGPGVAPEMRERIFEPFFSTKDLRQRTSGMGLGLALVKRTVAAAGGRINVEQAPGGGALFIVVLPLQLEGTTEAT
jgi:PAS domain S-box-containing protein